jgi:hypothetical protein
MIAPHVREYLPSIDIAIGVDPPLFLGRMAGLANASKLFRVGSQSGGAGDGSMSLVNLFWLGPSIHEEVIVQLIAHHDVGNRVAVELRALQWNPDPPTRSVYCALAEETVRPLLYIYNKSYGSRYRLRVQKPRKPYKLPPASETLFHRFTVTANKSSLHVSDWNRFYAFVKDSRIQAPEGVLLKLLLDEGFPAALANELDSLYQHLWAFKEHCRVR